MARVRRIKGQAEALIRNEMRETPRTVFQGDIRDFSRIGCAVYPHTSRSPAATRRCGITGMGKGA